MPAGHPVSGHRFPGTGAHSPFPKLVSSSDGGAGGGGEGSGGDGGGGGGGNGGGGLGGCGGAGSQAPHVVALKR